MSNPFTQQWLSQCDSCGDDIDPGDVVYAVDGSFVCRGCAEENDNVCECGNFKKSEFEKCYECAGVGKEEDPDDDISEF